MAVNPARAAAHRSLMKLAMGRYTNLEVSVTLDRTELSDVDRGLYTNLVYGTVERLITLDYVIRRYSKTPLTDITPEALTALRLGIYQLLYCDRIPDHAAVNESVDLAPSKTKGFVNAVLRSFLKDNKTVVFPDGRVEYLSVKYSVPEELCEKILSWYPDETEEILKAFLDKERVSLRVNTLNISVEAAAEKLKAHISEDVPDSIYVDSFDGVLEGIDEGLWFVQDEASTFAAKTVGACCGDTVVDTCAAPGGKSFSMAIDMKNEGRLYSFDLHKNKLSLINKTAKKLGITVITSEERDAREPKAELIGVADKVLCDAPCSGLGVIGKKPDIKYKDMSSIERLPEVQYAVLCGAAEYVRDGGVLVYSTCTINPDENENTVNKFLTEHKEFVPYPFTYNGEEVSMKTFLPGRDKTDGFFVARMMRRS